ncbi:DNA mismatch repair protein Mlh1 [Fimicolochytrium jonesii]|uniref:DNA mismatch repair protein Mlh1 n=1 Tax=Fimicolochytrium jonesii TaxID=1396493 RepID=UPI0022FF10D1|nr:DNA mismatch repair protein Mlh1 [Fimicolochytrium jonesii]KAI8824562.1 DNA mismatch repair protein Mlh1 [Fimicolochytrium jonesii]
MESSDSVGRSNAQAGAVPGGNSGHIRKLDEKVVNRIAAGEIIHRPANALKEMIENSLDAGATMIQITAKEGGLKLLQIQDNGHGIHKEDLPLVCERFATSKLAKYEDLSHIATYGFRGEALASISHIAHVCITTKRDESPCAWKAYYADGKLVPAKPGMSADPKPCAGNKGTQIVAEDLFYNMPTRRKALKSASEEYNRILDVIQRYAIHNSGISFTCKKQGASTADVHTPTAATTLDNIRYVYGATIAKELLELKHANDHYAFDANGYISNANFNTKKMVFLLFINHRSVDSPTLKRALEALYTEYLPRGTHPFVYLSMTIAPQNVDVNVHPTKREVHFLHEDKIVESICAAVQERLVGANQSRTFFTQTFLTGQGAVPSDTIAGPPKLGKTPEHKLVRTDSRSRTLDSFITTLTASSPSVSATSAIGSLDSVDEGDEDDDEDAEQAGRKRPRLQESGRFNTTRTLTPTRGSTAYPDITALNTDDATQPVDEDQDDVQMDVAYGPISPPPPPARTRERTTTRDCGASKQMRRAPVEVKLTSVLKLRQEFHRAGHKGLTEVFSEHTFVGFVDDMLALIQFQTKLFLVDFGVLSRELFYQLVLTGFSNFGHMRLSEPVRIADLVAVAVAGEDTSALGDDLMSPDEIAESCTRLLISHREMLAEYFSFSITATGTLLTLPVLLRGYTPPFHKLPVFLLRLASEVVWDSERECFETFARELAGFYAVEPPVELDGGGVGDAGPPRGTPRGMMDAVRAEYRRSVEHVVFPALKAHFVAGRRMVEDGSVVQLANLPDLYRVFERC